MSIWLISLAGASFVALCVATGMYLVRPGWSAGGFRGELGVAVITGAVISVAVLFLQIANEIRAERVEERRELVTMISTSTKLDNIDLSGKNLEDLHLGSKSFTEAKFDDASLDGANLSRSVFDRASFVRARLRNTMLTATSLQGAHLNEADLSGATIHSACLREADLRGADLSVKELTATDVWLAQYDSHTKWPTNPGWRRPADCNEPSCVLENRTYLYEGTCVDR